MSEMRWSALHSLTFFSCSKSEVHVCTEIFAERAVIVLGGETAPTTRRSPFALRHRHCPGRRLVRDP